MQYCMTLRKARNNIGKSTLRNISKTENKNILED
jgi:hypothetical protein